MFKSFHKIWSLIFLCWNMKLVFVFFFFSPCRNIKSVLLESVHILPKQEADTESARGLEIHCGVFSQRYMTWLMPFSFLNSTSTTSVEECYCVGDTWKTDIWSTFLRELTCAGKLTRVDSYTISHFPKPMLEWLLNIGFFPEFMYVSLFKFALEYTQEIAFLEKECKG